MKMEGLSNKTRGNHWASQKRRHNHQAAVLTTMMAPVKRVLENDDLFAEILLRLPPKLVLGVKSVSKRWYKFISTPSFRQRHSSLSQRFLSNTSIIMQWFSQDGGMIKEGKLHLVLGHDGLIPTKHAPKYPDVLFSYISCNYPHRCSFRILHASNGLFLLSSITKYGGLIINFLICNPLTKESIQLPSPSPFYGRLTHYTHPFSMRLVFDPSKSFHYKVVYISDIFQQNSMDAIGYRIQTYSSEIRNWYYFKDLSLCPEFSTLIDCVVLNGVLCFCPPRSSLNGEHVLSFDVETSFVKSLSVPQHEDSHPFREWLYFGESGGHLYLVYQDQYTYYNVWELKDIQDCFCSWTLKFQFRLGGIIDILYIHCNSEQELQIFLTMGNLIYCLNSKHYSAGRMDCIGAYGSDVTHLIAPRDILTFPHTLFPLI